MSANDDWNRFMSSIERVELSDRWSMKLAPEPFQTFHLSLQKFARARVFQFCGTKLSFCFKNLPFANDRIRGGLVAVTTALLLAASAEKIIKVSHFLTSKKVGLNLA